MSTRAGDRQRKAAAAAVIPLGAGSLLLVAAFVTSDIVLTSFIAAGLGMGFSLAVIFMHGALRMPALRLSGGEKRALVLGTALGGVFFILFAILAPAELWIGAAIALGTGVYASYLFASRLAANETGEASER